MQDGIADRDDALGAKLAAGRAKEGQQFGGATALVLVGLEGGMAFGLPRGSWLGNGLVGTSLIFGEQRQACRFGLLVGQFNQSFFSGVCSS
jgi:hypothetical protein